MIVQALPWMWFLLAIIINIIKPIISISLNQNNEHVQSKSTENIKRATQSEMLKIFASTFPIDTMYIYGPVIAAKPRVYRQVEPEATSSIEPTETKSPYELTDVKTKYDGLATTKTYDKPNNTVFPLKSTETYSTDSPYLVESKNAATGPSTTTIKPSGTSEINDITKPDKNLSVIGITAANNSNITDISKAAKDTEKIMILPSKEENAWLMEMVHNLLADAMIRIETENYVLRLSRRYEDLPVVEYDNFKWRKYSRAVVETFVLDFCRNYPKLTPSQEGLPASYDLEEYDSIYNMTLLKLKEKKGLTAIQLAVPVRRVADIYKAILDIPIGIVQSKCNHEMPYWLCLAEYVVHLADAAETCQDIWYHAQVHLTLLQNIRLSKGIQDPTDTIISELDSRLSKLEPNDDVNYLFDFIVHTLGDLGNRLSDILLSQASIYGLIRDLQAGGKLKCMNIDDDGL